MATATIERNIGSRKRRALLSASVVAALAIGLLMTGSLVNASGPTAVNLRTAASYAVLAGTPNITSTGLTVINGNVGIHPAASITGFPPGIIHGAVHAADAPALQAKLDLVTAYDYAAGLPVTANHGSLGGLTLVGGVYNSGGVTMDLTGTLTLDGENDPNATWVFQATSDLVTASASSIVFTRGGDPCNVFWQVSSSATLGSGSTFVGTIMALASITVADAVIVNGRLLARNGLVSLINDTITRSSCAAPVATPTPIATPTPTPIATPTPGATPTATPTPIATPTATPIATPLATPIATPTATPIATPVGTPVATPTPTPPLTAVVTRPTPTPTPRPAVPAASTPVPVITPPNTSTIEAGPQGGSTNLLAFGLLFIAALSMSKLYLDRRVSREGRRA